MTPRFPLVFGVLLVAFLGVWLLAAGLPGVTGPGSALPAGGAGGIGEGSPGAREAGLSGSAFGGVGGLPADAVLDALGSAFPVSPPYRERGRFGPAESAAFGYRVSLLAGDTLRVTVTDTEGDAAPPGLRLDAFLAGAGATPAPVPVHLGSCDGAGSLELPVGFAGDVVVLIHAGTDGSTFTTRIERSGALVFPVASRGPGDVLSHFLDLRDGGRRLHHGVDIAAPAGNPVRAVADGTIERVETTPLGGLTIRLTERRTGHVHYYAHLAAVFVEPGQRVAAGQTIGGVGNTGNARNTPPHLHYAVFDGNEILDPMKILRPTVMPFATDTPSALIGARARIRIAGAALRDLPTPFGPATSLALDQPVDVLAETGGYLRVRVDERQGYLAAWVVGP